MRGLFALALGSLLPLGAPLPSALAQQAPPEPAEPPEPAGPPDRWAAAYRRLARPPGSVARLQASIALGQGLRLNNPYRLRTQLGETGESLSLTSSYLDLGAAAAFGSADGLQHGAALRLSIGLAGVSQQSLAPSYLLVYRASPRMLGYGRAGAAILTMPDPNVGGELAGGFGYFVTAKLAIAGELVGNLFYGASTWDKTYTVYPVLSAQFGLMIDHEILP
ncbi:MAG TPA: hypothetical protein VLS89_06675 [Candidatus Nanopelagicales bacterium]|nr:hypothetical protein [Candidatus Nanopelagicales bacterium]